MNLQADIKLIQSELLKVKDPHLIEAFKQLLAYRATYFTVPVFPPVFW